jgi:GNAT superfamily N-acetyltransferase
MSENAGAHIGPLSGWELNAPRPDTVVRQFIDSQVAFQQLAGEAMGATVVVNDRFIAVDTGRPATFLNLAVLRKPLFGSELEQTMLELEAIYGTAGTSGSAVVYSPLPTSDLSPWGWTLSGHPPLQLRSPLTPILDTSSSRIQPISTDDERLTFERVMIEGFEMDEMRGSPPGSLIAPGMLADSRFGAWLGYLGDEAVAGAASMVENSIVEVVMVATLPQARRKGLGLAVTQAAARPELGLPAVLFSSDDGRPVYERIGFVPILRGSFWYRNR